MANDMARRKKRVSGRGESVAKTRERSSSKKQVKHAGKKRPKKATRLGPDPLVKPGVAIYAADHGLMTAFHHMQRASVVISLMKKGTGKDLQGLLKRGVKLYRKAVEDDAKNKFVLRAIGVLRAAEHLSMAGLYAAREKHRQRVTAPTPEWLTKVVVETSRRLEQIEHQERGKGTDLFPVAVELVRQAQDPKLHAHLAFELAMAADALCFALENGL
jgi:hypothetical protein